MLNRRSFVAGLAAVPLAGAPIRSTRVADVPTPDGQCCPALPEAALTPTQAKLQADLIRICNEMDASGLGIKPATLGALDATLGLLIAYGKERGDQERFVRVLKKVNRTDTVNAAFAGHDQVHERARKQLPKVSSYVFAAHEPPAMATLEAVFDVLAAGTLSVGGRKASCPRGLAVIYPISARGVGFAEVSLPKTRVL